MPPLFHLPGRCDRNEIGTEAVRGINNGNFALAVAVHVMNVNAVEATIIAHPAPSTRTPELPRHDARRIRLQLMNGVGVVRNADAWRLVRTVPIDDGDRARTCRRETLKLLPYAGHPGRQHTASGANDKDSAVVL